MYRSHILFDDFDEANKHLEAEREKFFQEYPDYPLAGKPLFDTYPERRKNSLIRWQKNECHRVEMESYKTVFGLVLTYAKNGHCKILDFGGNLGWYIDIIEDMLAQLPLDITVSCDIIEHPDVVSAFKDQYSRSNLNFYGNLSDVDHNSYDIVLARGVLQYIAGVYDTDEVLQKLASKTPVLYLAQTTFSPELEQDTHVRFEVRKRWKEETIYAPNLKKVFSKKKLEKQFTILKETSYPELSFNEPSLKFSYQYLDLIVTPRR